MNWSDWEAALLEAIADPAQAAPDPALGLAPAGLAVYRNNYRVGLIDTLAFIYPITRLIVGEAFFTGLAREYVKRHGSDSGNLHRYGANFADFVAGFKPCRELPYLPDAARLEWAAHRCYYAADASAASLDSLAAIPQQSWDQLRVAPLPGVALIESAYPLASLWLAHQPGQTPAAGLLARPAEAALVYRADGATQVSPCSPAEGRLLSALFAGATLENAAEQALALDAELDLQAALLGLFQRPLLADICL